MPTGWTPNTSGTGNSYIDSTVAALTFVSELLYAGGNFTSIGRVRHQGLAVFADL